MRKFNSIYKIIFIKAALFVSIFFSLLLNTSCSLFEDPVVEEIAQTMLENESNLLATSKEMNMALLRLERIEQYKKPRIMQVKDENMRKYNLGTRVYVDWSGPIEPLTKEIAEYSNYKFKAIGMAPAIPVLVNVSHDNVEVGDIIREMHLQAKDRASIAVYPKSKTIELRYKETS